MEEITYITKEEMVKKVTSIPYDYPKLFSVVFVKKDGSERHMTCRRGVQSRSRGVQDGNDKPYAPAYNFSEKGLVSVFDVNKEKEITGEDKKGAYRCFSASSVTQLKLEGVVYQVKE